ncbi:helix-turn-helix domain-containing protein [Rhodococcoides fascians]|uniref:helix-turn-helix domain-containing protein n=1 Tax=Rhodococcoides fascians TaxID=1828 RepID=UPI000691A29B|nr:helix-turn-helix transcriptional regulator [Rhodococcus fascians]
MRDRRAQLSISQVELWKAGGPSNSTLTNIESGRDMPVHPKMLRKLDFALGWPPGRAYELLHGDSLGDAGAHEHPPLEVTGCDGAADTAGAPRPVVLAEPVIAALLYDADQARRALVRYSNRQLGFDAVAARLYRLIDTAELLAHQASSDGVD